MGMQISPDWASEWEAILRAYGDPLPDYIYVTNQPFDHGSRDRWSEVNWEEGEKLPEEIKPMVLNMKECFVSKWLLLAREEGGLNERKASKMHRLLDGRLELEIALYPPLEEEVMIIDNQIVKCILNVTMQRSSRSVPFERLAVEKNLRCYYRAHCIERYSEGIEINETGTWEQPCVYYVRVSEFWIEGAQPGYEYIVEGDISILGIKVPIPLSHFGVWYDPSDEKPKGLYLRRKKGIQ